MLTIQLNKENYFVALLKKLIIGLLDILNFQMSRDILRSNKKFFTDK
jgi:hypothetical protein